MEANDTVMSKELRDNYAPDHDQDYRGAIIHWDIDGLLQAQAEITGKIMKQEGIKEVVELMRKRNVCSPAITGNDVKYVPFELTEGWQTHLRDWGITS